MWIVHSCVSATVEDKSQLQWPCYECAKRFRTSAELQKHLDVHDDAIVFDADAQNDPECLLTGISRRGNRRKRQAPVASSDVSAAGQSEDTTVTVCQIWRGLLHLKLPIVKNICLEFSE